MAVEPEAFRANRPKVPLGGWKTHARWSIDDVFALQALQSLGGEFLPWTGYALSPSALHRVLCEVDYHRPALIVELGAGLSTIVLARYLRQRGYPIRLLSVDNDASWIGIIQERLESEGLGRYATLVHARMGRWEKGVDLHPEPTSGGWQFEPPAKWFDPDPIHEAIGDDQVGLLLVDGPKGKGTISRYPAALELEHRLASDVVILLDDAQRAPETEIMCRWSTRLDLEFNLPKGSAIAVGRRRVDS